MPNYPNIKIIPDYQRFTAIYGNEVLKNLLYNLISFIFKNDIDFSNNEGKKVFTTILIISKSVLVFY